jgi:flagellar biosynthesis/type III secretory pathway chaperone
MDDLISNVDTLLAEVQHLEQVLQAEFEAIKTQNLDQLDLVQQQKEASLLKLSDGRFEQTVRALQTDRPEPLAAGLMDKWQQLIDATQLSQSQLKRNQLIIQQKLVVLRDALHSLYRTDAPQSLQLYNRSGKISGGSAN